MLLLFYAIIIIFLISILLMFSEIRFVVKNFHYSNMCKIKEDKIKDKIEDKSEFKIQLFLLGKIKCLSIRIQNDKSKNRSNNKLNNKIVESLKRSLKRNLLKFNNQKFKRIKIKNKKNLIKYLFQKIKIKKLNIEIMLDTKSVELTAILVGLISTIIPIAIRNNIKSKYYFKIIPLYKNINSFNIKLNCIFSIKIVHIINMLKYQVKKEKCEDERSSNRRFNANCNGKYKKYDRC